MTSMLEKLLEIRDAEEDTRSETQKRPNLSEKAEEGNYTVPPPIGPKNGISDSNRGITGPDMMESWREAYRIFTQFAPRLRAAAEKPDDECDAAQIFCEALDRVRAMCEPGGDAEILGKGIYSMLADVWETVKRVENG